MRHRRSAFTATALALGLSLTATQALAGDFRIINSSVGDLRVTCSTGGLNARLSDGRTGNYSCSGSVIVEQRPGSNPQHAIPHDCDSNKIKESTVKNETMVGNLMPGDLIMTHRCISGS